MPDAETLREIADRLEEAEDVRDYLKELEGQIRGLQQENDYLNDLLWQMGVQVHPDRLSVGQAMDIMAALRNIT